MLAPRSTDTEKIIILQSHDEIYRDRGHMWLLKSSGGRLTGSSHGIGAAQIPC